MLQGLARCLFPHIVSKTLCSLEHGGLRTDGLYMWQLRAHSAPGALEGNCKNSYDLALEVPRCHSLLTKHVTVGQPGVRGGQGGSCSGRAGARNDLWMR